MTAVQAVPLEELTTNENHPASLPDCPICLEAMEVADLRHPVQCHCGYNFCRSCLQSLISCSQDDYEMASDGSRQVKIFLHCPNCRSDLQATVRDTLLLRRTDAAQAAVQAQEDEEDSNGSSSSNHNNGTTGTTDPHLRFRIKAMLQDDLVHEAIVLAAQREADFFGWSSSSSSSENSSDGSETDTSRDDGSSGNESSAASLSENHNDWGVEADLFRGVHDSFRMPLSQSAKEMALREPQRILTIDKSLLGTWADQLTAAQQERVTDLWTSGDPAQLVEGAEILRKTITLAVLETATTKLNNNRSRHQKKQDSFRGSVYALIAEAHQARQKVAEKQRRRRSSRRTSLVRRQVAMREIQQQAQYLQTHPLPVRLPKSVHIPLPDPSERHLDQNGWTDVEFCNDSWDGTLRDVFYKIDVARNNKTGEYSTSRPAARRRIDHGPHRGVTHILDSDGPVRVDVPQPRVVVAAVCNCDLGQKGLLKGDVVTHVNEHPWTGTAQELQQHLYKLYCDEETTSIHLALNCSVAVAEVLHRRSLVE